jgi:acetyltransferase
MYRSSQGRELHIGVIRDQVLGPVISFGLGGTSIELLGDRAIALPPLNTLIARDLIRRTKAAKALGKFRQLAPINFDRLEQTLLRVSEMVCELPEIREMDLNPIVSDTENTVALDARIVVDHTSRTRQYAHMAIHPYPSHLSSKWQMSDGTDVVIRPIRPEDAAIEQDFMHNLSPEAKYMRFMQTMQELTPEMLVRFTQIDYDREIALVAVVKHQGKEMQVAVTRFGTNPDGESCEFAIAVADSWTHKGLGTKMLSALIETARSRGLKLMEGDVLEQNRAMLHLAKKLGFVVHEPDDSRVRHVSLTL